MAEKRVTLEEVLAARTPRGGWTKKQLAEWGIHWPPKTGWIKRLTGDPAASVPMPGRTPVAMQLARKTRLELEQENVRLRAALREAYEVYAGSDGFIPETAGEGYQQQIIRQMVNCISAALGGVNGH